jgi:hypothetical protein
MTSDTEAIIAILEDKRAEVMSREEAGYFVHDWQEISDQVRSGAADDIPRSPLPGDQEQQLETNSIMNMRPLYDRIVVKRIEEQTTRHGIIPDSGKEKQLEHHHTCGSFFLQLGRRRGRRSGTPAKRKHFLL